MASSQLLSLVISAVDRASGVLGKIQGGLRGIGGAAGDAKGQSESLSNAIAFGMAKAEVALGLVNQAYGKLQGMVSESANLQLENMSAAQTFAAVAGKSYEEGAGFIDRMNEALSKSAAALPGATKDYTTLARTIQDNLIDGFKGADGKLQDMQGFEKALIGISESYGVLSAASNVPIGNTALGLTKALGGASVAELRQIQAFEQNPALLNEIEKRLQKVGAKTLKDLDTKSRIQLIKEVGEKFVDSDFKKRASETFDGLWQSFVSSIFDPMTGLFGLSRDLDAKTKGTQSAFTSLNTLLNSLIGSGGLFEQISGIFQTLGLTVDPMRVLRDGIDRVNQFVVYLNGFLGSIRTGLGEGYGNFGDLLASKFRMVQADIASYLSRLGFDTSSLQNFASDLGFQASRLLNQGIQFLNGIDYSAILSKAGATIATGINFMFKALFSFLAGLDYGQIGGLALNLAGGLFKGLGAILDNLDWRVYAALAGGLLVAFLIPGILTFAGGLVATFLAGTVGLPVLLIAAAVFAIASLAKAIYENWGSIEPMLTGFFNSIGQYFTGIFQILGGILTLNGDMVKQGFQNLFTSIMGWVDAVYDTWANLTGNKTRGEQRAEQAMANAEARYQSAVAAKAGGGVVAGGIAPTIAPTVLGPAAPAFNGHIPNAANGLVGAAVAESNAMPTGAQVVVANDREFILKPTGKSASSGNKTFNFYINGTNAKEIAQEVMAIIQSAYEAEMNTQLV